MPTRIGMRRAGEGQEKARAASYPMSPLAGWIPSAVSGSAGRVVIGTGREQNGRFGVRDVNKQTFVHGDCQRQASTQSGDGAGTQRARQ